MCCNHGLISRSDPRFIFFPSTPPTISSSSSSNSRIFFPSYSSTPQVSRIKSESLIAKSKLNDVSFDISSPRIFFPSYSSTPQVSRTKFRSIKVKSKLNDVVSYATTEPYSFYELLGIPETGSLLEIKQAYKQLARKYHPDVSPPDRVEEYTQRFIRVQEAYETLSDPRMRAMYDKDMAKGLHFAFSVRRRCQNDESMEEKGEWKNRWQSQVSELKRRSMHKESGNSMSWGARMRRQRNEASS